MSKRIRRIELLFELLRVLAALLIAYAVVLVCITLMVDDAMEGIYLFMLGPFSSMRRIGNVVARMIPYMMTGAGMCFCYASNRFNLAGEGGFLISGCMVTFVALSLRDSAVPGYLLIPLLLIVGAVCGGFATGLAAVLREKLGTNELVVSIMTNYILLYLSNYILKTFLQDRTASYITSEFLPQNAKLPNLIARTDIHAGLFISLAMVAVVIIIFYLTPLGSSIRICGNNSEFARYSGINVTLCLIASQVLGGVLAGMGGAVEIMGNYDRFQWTSLTQYGFDGLMVAVLARKNPLFVPLGAFLLAYMRIGANILNANTSVPIEFVQVMQAVLILFIAAQTFLEKQKNAIIFKEARAKMQEGGKAA